MQKESPPSKASTLTPSLPLRLATASWCPRKGRRVGNRWAITAATTMCLIAIADHGLSSLPA